MALNLLSGMPKARLAPDEIFHNAAVKMASKSRRRPKSRRHVVVVVVCWF
jgi:hypothetical protein